MRLAIIVSFLNEERYLPRLLESIAAQTRKPDQLLLVDDGSTDRSADIAAAFAEQWLFARALRRPPRPPEADRLATAGELRSFEWASRQLDDGWDVVVKMDADLELQPNHLEHIMGRLEADDGLGVAGAYLSIREDDGTVTREEHPRHHVRGPNKFYRREAFEVIHPLQPFLGWDAVDESIARMHGWRTESFDLPGGDSIHLRPTGSHDGSLRAWRRWGECAWGSGAHPLHVAVSTAYRIKRKPRGIGAVHYFIGWLTAGAQRKPRINGEVRQYVRREQLRDIRRRLHWA